MNPNLARWAAAALTALILWLAARLGLHITGDLATVLAAGIILAATALVPDLLSVLGHRKGPLSEWAMGHTAGARAARAAAFREAAALVNSLAAEHQKAASATGVTATATHPELELYDWTQSQLANAGTYLGGLAKVST